MTASHVRKVTEESFVEFMSKCGMVEFDISAKKIYRDEEGRQKGDGHQPRQSPR